MKLIIPGPVVVSKNTFDAISHEMIGHRGEEFKELYKFCIEELKDLLYTKGEVTIHTSSGTIMMEAAIRNLVKENVLVCDTGSFGKKFGDVAIALEMNVLIYDPFINEEVCSEIGAKKVEIKELIKGSDYISPHVPLN